MQVFQQRTLVQTRVADSSFLLFLRVFLSAFRIFLSATLIGYEFPSIIGALVGLIVTVLAAKKGFLVPEDGDGISPIP